MSTGQKGTSRARGTPSTPPDRRNHERDRPYDNPRGSVAVVETRLRQNVERRYDSAKSTGCTDCAALDHVVSASAHDEPRRRSRELISQGRPTWLHRRWPAPRSTSSARRARTEPASREDVREDATNQRRNPKIPRSFQVRPVSICTVVPLPGERKSHICPTRNSNCPALSYFLNWIKRRLLYGAPRPRGVHHMETPHEMAKRTSIDGPDTVCGA